MYTQGAISVSVLHFTRIWGTRQFKWSTLEDIHVTQCTKEMCYLTEIVLHNRHKAQQVLYFSNNFHTLAVKILNPFKLRLHINMQNQNNLCQKLENIKTDEINCQVQREENTQGRVTMQENHNCEMRKKNCIYWTNSNQLMAKVSFSIFEQCFH